MQLAAGTPVSHNVVLMRPLDRGGMGTVWVAEHRGLNTHVAVKFVAEKLAKDPAMTARFALEAQAAAQIKSPHVVQVFDHGTTDDGVPYIVMELLEGEDLADRIRRRGTLDLRETALLVQQTCKALSRAHALGIVHRDIKPSNIYVTEIDGEPFVKVLDFGIAKKAATDPGAAAVTASGAMVGTPWYMSPEQVVSSKHVDFRSDLWSLAVVAYHALTGKVPFDGDTVGAIFIAIDKGTFSPPCAVREGLPPDVDAWFARALSLAVNARFRSAREMGDALARIADGKPMEAPPELAETTPAPPAPPPSPLAASPPSPAAPPAPSTRSWDRPAPPAAAPPPSTRSWDRPAPPTFAGTSRAVPDARRGSSAARAIAVAVAGLAVSSFAVTVAMRARHVSPPAATAPSETPPPLPPAAPASSATSSGAPPTEPSASTSATVHASATAHALRPLKPTHEKTDAAAGAAMDGGRQIDRGF